VSNPTAAYDLAPLAGIALVGALLATVPVLWVVWRHRASGPAERTAARLRALTVLTLCLTFDLVLFGVVPFESPVPFILTLLGLVGGILWGRMAPLSRRRGGGSKPKPVPAPVPAPAPEPPAPDPAPPPET